MTRIPHRIALQRGAKPPRGAAGGAPDKNRRGDLETALGRRHRQPPAKPHLVEPDGIEPTTSSLQS
jgi:hypothetical protein